MVDINTSFNKYPDYKDSGVEWLGEIPTNWKQIANRHIFKLKKIQVGKKSNEYDLLSLTLKGIVKRNLENGGKFPAEFDTYQEVNVGDFVFCLFDVEETPRTVGLSKYDGMITGAYTVMEPVNGFERGFLYYFYLNLDAKKRLKPLYRGLRNTIPKDSFFALKTFVPTLEEQTAIANFLDKKTAKIDTAIAQKQEMISLLKERKQIIIQNAVTGKVVWNEKENAWTAPAKVKDSGVEWIGDIPEGWDLRKLGSFAKVGNGSTPSRSNMSFWLTGDIPWLNSSTVNQEIINQSDQFVTKRAVRYCHLPIVDPGTVLMAITGEGKTRGMTAICNIRATINQHIAYIRINRDVCYNFFLLRAFHSMYSFLRAESSGQGSTKGAITCDSIKKLKIVLPSYEEQINIVDYIEAQSTKMDKAVALQQKQIEKLKEYKSVLIDSAVTGKIKITM